MYVKLGIGGDDDDDDEDDDDDDVLVLGVHMYAGYQIYVN